MEDEPPRDTGVPEKVTLETPSAKDILVGGVNAEPGSSERSEPDDWPADRPEVEVRHLTVLGILVTVVVALGVALGIPIVGAALVVALMVGACTRLRDPAVRWIDRRFGWAHD